MNHVKTDNYKKLNASFEKTLVYRIGIDSGFFSEYNNMVLAILYCLDNKIQFKLYSNNANFGIKKGWTDYFEPFCEEVVEPFHEKLNYRYPLPKWRLIMTETIRRRSLKYVRWKIKDHFFNVLISPYLKKKYKFDYFTFELFDEIRGYSIEKIFNIPELCINDTLQYACKKIIDLTWNFKIEILKKIQNHITYLDLPSKYVSLHIRGGDKHLEFDIQPIEMYLDKLHALTIESNVFLLTDDYSVVTEIKRKTNKTIYSLCLKSEKGYYHSNFMHKGKKEQEEQLIKLFASIEVMASSHLFIGTFSSNPGMYLGMRCPSKSYSIDFSNWLIW